jgi:predicted SAM-dependent methyltransferase
VKKIALNIACGERIVENDSTYNFINVDIRKLPNVHMICDVRMLPFKDESFNFILASDIVEHFPKTQTPYILREWVRILKKGSEMEIRTPNLEWIIKQYLEKKNTEHTSWLLYGGQDYEFNFHYVIFDRKWLNYLCGMEGLEEVSYEEKGSNFILIVRKK